MARRSAVATGYLYTTILGYVVLSGWWL